MKNSEQCGDVNEIVKRILDDISRQLPITSDDRLRVLEQVSDWCEYHKAIINS